MMRTAITLQFFRETIYVHKTLIVRTECAYCAIQRRTLCAFLNFVTRFHGKRVALIVGLRPNYEVIENRIQSKTIDPKNFENILYSGRNDSDNRTCVATNL